MKSFLLPVVTGILSLVISSGVFPQQIVPEEIVVEAPYHPSLSEANKIGLSPLLPLQALEKPAFNYKLLQKSPVNQVVPEPIVPAQIKGESLTRLRNNYFRLGMGTYTTPYLEFFANTTRSKKHSVGVRIRHLSSSGKIRDYAYSGFSDNEVKLDAKKLSRDHTLSAGLDYRHDMIHRYGFKPADFPGITLSKEDTRQIYQRLGVNAGLMSNYTGDDRMNHEVSLGYRYFADRYETSEHMLSVSGGVNRQTGFFDFSSREWMGADLEFTYFIHQDTLVSQNTGLLGIKPYYRLKFNSYSFRAGINPVVEIDSVTQMHFYPEVHAEVEVIPAALITYAGISGKMERNGISALTEMNPFIRVGAPLMFTNHKFEQYGGIKGRIGRIIDFDLNFTNSSLEQLPFFIQDTLSAPLPGLFNQYTVVYDRVRRSTVNANIHGKWKDRLSARIHGAYHSFFMDNEEKPWHQPAFEMLFSVSYSIGGKILLRSELKTFSKMYAPDFSGTSEGIAELSGAADLHLGLEYRYSRVLSAFLNFSNLLNQSYERWYQYPSQRFSLMGGITYSF
ncbi:MAG: hypothetical protein JW861_00230 [Bacteroidales bacterium]|nr:hypothetical protein [Bacteroidales bacterium]